MLGTLYKKVRQGVEGQVGRLHLTFHSTTESLRRLLPIGHDGAAACGR